MTITAARRNLAVEHSVHVMRQARGLVQFGVARPGSIDSIRSCRFRTFGCDCADGLEELAHEKRCQLVTRFSFINAARPRARKTCDGQGGSLVTSSGIMTQTLPASLMTIATASGSSGQRVVEIIVAHNLGLCESSTAQLTLGAVLSAFSAVFADGGSADFLRAPACH
jgi:hypothetical protein